MIKAKLVALSIGSILTVSGLGAVINQINWSSQSNLSKSQNNVNQYIESSQTSMQKAESIIKQKNQEIQTLESENQQKSQQIKSLKKNIDVLSNKDNQMIKSLNSVISTLEGNSRYKNMTTTQKENTLNELLSDWGYGRFSIGLADKIFNLTDGWAATLTSSNNISNNNTSNNNVSSNNISNSNKTIKTKEGSETNDKI